MAPQQYLTTTFQFRYFDQQYQNWHSGLNQNWQDLDAALVAIQLGQYLHLTHSTASGTDGGDINLTWTTRPLGVPLTNRITGASVAANQITLPVGKYRIRASGSAFSCDDHKARLYNVTDAVTVLLGTAARAKLSYLDMSPSEIVGEFEVVETAKVFEIQHIAATAKTGSGMGKAAALGLAEIFAVVEIWKLNW